MGASHCRKYHEPRWLEPAQIVHPFHKWHGQAVERFSGCPIIKNHYCLVVWNMFYFPYIWDNTSHWRTHIFQRGRWLTHQPDYGSSFSPCSIVVVKDWSGSLGGATLVGLHACGRQHWFQPYSHRHLLPCRAPQRHPTAAWRFFFQRLVETQRSLSVSPP